MPADYTGFSVKNIMQKSSATFSDKSAKNLATDFSSR
jgi:hypothetical protein